MVHTYVRAKRVSNIFPFRNSFLELRRWFHRPFVGFSLVENSFFLFVSSKKWIADYI